MAKKKRYYGAVDKDTDLGRAKPVIVIHPGRLSGAPTIGSSRLPAHLVADVYWYHGSKEVKAQWDYMTKADIVTCCWYVAWYGSKTERSRFRKWVEDNDRAIWMGKFKDCAWPPRKEDGDGK